jgi:hypothetical protein
MSDHTTAVPPSFHLQLRLIDAHEVPFINADYVVHWGKDVQRGVTSSNGGIDVTLDGDPSIPGGRVEIRMLRGNAYVTVLTIPLLKHVARGFSYNSAPPGAPPSWSHDVMWRLQNLGHTAENFWRSTSPDRDEAMLHLDANEPMLRFKARYHGDDHMRLNDWLDPLTSTSDQRLVGDQDDRAVELLLMKHDGLEADDATARLAHAKKFGEPL